MKNKLKRIPKLGYVIGRFQPLHDGHRKLLNEAVSNVDHLKILIGSANSERTLKNPFTYEERVEYIDKVLSKVDIFNEKKLILCGLLSNTSKKYSFRGLDDKERDDEWLSSLTYVILNDLHESGIVLSESDVTIFYHEKEGNDYIQQIKDYLGSRIDNIKFVNIESTSDICATDIRNQWYAERNTIVPSYVQDLYDSNLKEREAFKDYRYPETLHFLTVDAVVQQENRILLVKRKHSPGINMWALPGGFKNNNETFMQASVRELEEETNLKITHQGKDVDNYEMFEHISNFKLFDNPKRCESIMRVNVAYHVKLDPSCKVSIKASDDALEARFFDIAVIDKMKYDLFLDHYKIIKSFL